MLTDSKGNPIPEHDPRLPRPSMIEAQKDAADLLAAEAEKQTGRSFGMKVDADARLDALISLMVPPEGPVRDLFEFRTHENRAESYRTIIDAALRARAAAEEATRKSILLDGVRPS